MPKIKVTEECMTALRASSKNGFHQTFKKMPDGDWAGPVTDDTFDRLLKYCSGGMSVSDAIMLALAAERGAIN